MQKVLKKLDGKDYLQVLSNTVIPTSYLGPIEYYAILLKYNCRIEIHENFIKQSLRNRCEIDGPNGKIRLTVPKENNGKQIVEKIKICYKENWQKNHWKSITSTYNSSPFFQFYKDDLKKIYEIKDSLLINFNNRTQQIILNILRHNTHIRNTTMYIDKGKFLDLRNYSFNSHKPKKYSQVFIQKNNFIPHLSILDLICNVGPDCTHYLQKLNI